jgi:single-stranded-DNA-specific exonuclease
LTGTHQKKWIFAALPASPEPDPEEWGVSPLTIRILQNRGIADPVQARQFLSPALADFPDPFLMKGTRPAALRLLAAIRRGEKIALFGDYDVDGTTAVALLLLFLRRAGARADFYLPHRLKEGYGLNLEAVERIKAEGAGVLVTADCGISNLAEIRRAGEIGLEVIVTDHHEIPPALPPALAVLNPKQKDCPYPFKELAGVGVVFNLVIALRSLLREEGLWNEGGLPNLREYLDLAALGTVSDAVPLTGVNRVIAKHGLIQLARSSRCGILALKEAADSDGAAVDTAAVNFRFAPRINAAGRLDDASAAVRMLISDEPGEGREIAARLNALNLKRQQIEERILAEARGIIRRSPEFAQRKTLVLASPGWHPGVIGIVASRLAEEFRRPTILVALGEKRGRGSGRSLPGFSLYQAVKSCGRWTEGFGGHDQAVGLTVSPEALEDFSRGLEEFAQSHLPAELLVPSLTLDASASLKQMDDSFLSELDSLAPFGTGNPEPVIGFGNLEILDSRPVGKIHLRLRVREGQTVRDAIGFRLADLHPLKGRRANLALSPQANVFQGRRTLQLKVVDLQDPA